MRIGIRQPYAVLFQERRFEKVIAYSHPLQQSRLRGCHLLRYIH
jgi:hypothetical protein